MLRSALFAFLLLLPAPLHAADSKSLNLPAPAPVVDEAGVLNSSDFSSLDSLVRSIKNRSGVEVSVYLASSLRDLPIEDFANAAATQWGLGTKKVDRGLLFLIAPNEHKMRFEVGYGLEGDITDAFSRRVLDNQVRPYFKQGDYYNGILAGLSAVQEKVPLGLQENERPQPAQSRGNGFPFWVVVFFIWGIFFLLSRLGAGRSYRNRYGGPWWWGGGGGGFGGGGFGGGGGSSWGGGGGSFGGGGASSGW